ncbi:MAG: hypothetical protein JO065_14720 [Acidobacteria bacterium]|nr:hypothetical protein [Acidobacteriota bacterium]
MIRKKLKSIYDWLSSEAPDVRRTSLLLTGKQMSWHVATLPPNVNLREVGFKVFSQWDEDGIIQYLISKLPIENETFIEFGVENYEESNTRFLLLNNHWRGMVMDARGPDVSYIRRDRIYWQYDLRAMQAWITRENINELLRSSGFSEDLGLMSIDIDGNDYWIWESIDSFRPRIMIIEYNSLFGLEPIVVPYQDRFNRTAAHYSNLYYGASLGALQCLAKRKEYLLLGSNIWGHNAFFVRQDIAAGFQEVDLSRAYVESRFRESRDKSGNLSYLRGKERLEPIKHLPVTNVATGETRSIRDVCRCT